MEVVWIQLKTKSGQVLVGNVYRPPDSPGVWMDSLSMMLERVLQEQMMVLLMGDFNCDMLNPEYRAERLAMVTTEYGFEQMIDGPIYQGDSNDRN